MLSLPQHPSQPRYYSLFIFVSKRTESFECTDLCAFLQEPYEAMHLFVCLLTNSIFVLWITVLCPLSIFLSILNLTNLHVSFVCYICSKYFVCHLNFNLRCSFLVLKFLIACIKISHFLDGSWGHALLRSSWNIVEMKLCGFLKNLVKYHNSGSAIPLSFCNESKPNSYLKKTLKYLASLNKSVYF